MCIHNCCTRQLFRQLLKATTGIPEWSDLHRLAGEAAGLLREGAADGEDA